MNNKYINKIFIFIVLSISIIELIICGILIIYISDFNNKSSNIYDDSNLDTINGIKSKIKTGERRMSLVAVGDALIHGAVYIDAYQGNNNYDFRSMFDDIEPLIQNYDLKYYNQETIIGGKDLGVSHYPRFNSPDEIGLNLIDIGFNMVSLANNHTMDMGEIGILNSVKFWKDKNIVVNGQSNSFMDRNSIEIYQQNGIRYAFIAYTDGVNGLTIPSGKEYLVNIYSDEQAKIDIDSIREKVDVIIVSMHWGEEYTHNPTQEQKRQAEYLSSLGVNLIIGSHPHVIMPVDYVGDTLVIYSLGNFISGQSPLGIAKIIGLMVGMDIVLDEYKVTFENIDYKLLYTYCTDDYKNYKVIPFDNLNENILPNYKNIEKEYMNIVTREVEYD